MLKSPMPKAPTQMLDEIAKAARASIRLASGSPAFLTSDQRKYRRSPDRQYGGSPDPPATPPSHPFFCLARTLRNAGSLCAIALCVALLPPSANVAVAQLSVPNADFVVAKPVADMYSQPKADSDVVSQAIYGAGVLSLEQHDGWYKIRTADDYTGWVATPDLLPLKDRPYAPDGKLVEVAGLSANIYREPDVTRHAPLLLLPWEARLEIAPGAADGSSRWIQVRLVDGSTAWVQRGDVSSKFVPLTIDQMLQLAHRFLGVTYTWGGASSFGFDCSGFTQMLVRQRGIEMPRDAKVQAVWSGGLPVDRKDLQPGDLLFFGANAAKITHTGMYLGGGMFIHDTTHDHPGVQISRLDDMPWTQLLVAARRIK
jgi:cell wall-associated NlpC family hydrolase